MQLLRPLSITPFFYRSFLGLLFLALLGACSKSKVVIDGERESVIILNPKISADKSLTTQKTSLSKPVLNKEWTQQFGESDHALHPLAYQGQGKILWKLNIGQGSSSNARLMSRPIFAKNKIFAFDAYGTLSAFDQQTRKKLWTVQTHPKGTSASQSLGGGICYGEGLIFATTGFGEVRAYDADTGTLKWSEAANAPIRIAPVYHQGRIYSISVESQLEARDALKGELLWSHTGIAESAGLLGGSGPSISGESIIVPHASGEVSSISTRNGQVLWQENLASSMTLSSLGMIAHIHAYPVIENNLMFVMSHSGIMAALNLTTGQKIWSKDIGGIQTPALSNGHLFVITDGFQIANIQIQSGKAHWATELPIYADAKNTSERIYWSGPVLGEGHLYCVGSHKKVIAIDIQGGNIAKTWDLPYPAKLPPQIVNGVLYVLCDNGTLVAFN